MARLRNTLPTLLGQYHQEKGKRLTLTRLARETGVSRDTLSRMANDPETAINSETIMAICKFFKKQPGDLLFIEYAPGELDEPAPHR
jgi:DNA-binding Xre family transcriptional regulator